MGKSGPSIPILRAEAYSLILPDHPSGIKFLLHNAQLTDVKINLGQWDRHPQQPRVGARNLRHICNLQAGG